MTFEQEISQETEESQSPPLLIMATTTPSCEGSSETSQRRFSDQVSNENQNLDNIHNNTTERRDRETFAPSDVSEKDDPTTSRKRIGGKSTEYDFDCNICLESVQDPVVTRCGHLYCWACLYKWLEPGLTSREKKILHLNSKQRKETIREFKRAAERVAIEEVRNESDERDDVDPVRRSCPVCKANCNLSSIVPIYVKNKKKRPSLNNKEEAILQADEICQIVTPPRPNPFVQYPNNSSSTNNYNIGTRSNLAMRVPAPESSSQSILVSSSFDHSIVPVLLGFPDMTSQSSPPHLIARSRSVSSNSDISPEEHREYIMMEDATTNFLSKILLVMGSTVVFILLIF